MDCLFHGEYALALKYFESYKAETQGKYTINQIDNMTSSNVVRYLLNTDVLYSKGICLKHMENEYGAIHEFEETNRTCEQLLQKLLNDNGNLYGSKKKMLIYQKYIQSKRSKAFNDLVSMYFITRQYKNALEKLESIIKDIKPNLDSDTNELYKNRKYQYWYYLLKI